MTDQEINEAVARKLGWRYEPCPDEFTYCQRMDWKNPKGSLTLAIPAYSTDIAAAWEIVENWTTVGDYRFELHGYGQHSWGAGWANGNGWLASADAPTASRAICEAFLKLKLP